MPKTKLYCCRRCNGEFNYAVYVRLALNPCGIRKARHSHIHYALPVGHFCAECLSLFLQTLTEHVDKMSAHEASTCDPVSSKSVCKHLPGFSLSELAGSSTEESAGNGADRPATQTADRTTGLTSVPLSAGAEKTGPLSPAALGGREGGGSEGR
jgi:hypothetical protein